MQTGVSPQREEAGHAHGSHRERELGTQEVRQRRESKKQTYRHNTGTQATQSRERERHTGDTGTERGRHTDIQRERQAHLGSLHSDSDHPVGCMIRIVRSGQHNGCRLLQLDLAAAVHHHPQLVPPGD